jgi:hypothetical protein
MPYLFIAFFSEDTKPFPQKQIMQCKVPNKIGNFKEWPSCKMKLVWTPEKLWGGGYVGLPPLGYSGVTCAWNRFSKPVNSDRRWVSSTTSNFPNHPSMSRSTIKHFTPIHQDGNQGCAQELYLPCLHTTRQHHLCRLVRRCRCSAQSSGSIHHPISY